MDYRSNHKHSRPPLSSRARREVAEQRQRRIRILEDYELGHAVRMDDFESLFGSSIVNTHREYVRGYLDSALKWRRSHPRVRHLMSLLALGGLNDQLWLPSTEAQPFTTEAWCATDYDALRHYLDVIGIIRLRQPLVDEDTGVRIDRLYFGLDPMISPEPYSLWQCLTRGTSAKTPLPFGFSVPHYVTDRQGPIGEIMMPRYCITAGLVLSDSLVQVVSEPERDGLAPFAYNDSITKLARYRILALMLAQNTLYQAMLPDCDDSQVTSPLVNRATAVLDAMDGILRIAVNPAIIELFAAGTTAEPLAAKVLACYRAGRSQLMRKAAQAWQLQVARQQFGDLDHYIKSLHLATAPEHLRDPFVELLTRTNQLYHFALNDKLNDYRCLQSRHQMWPAAIVGIEKP